MRNFLHQTFTFSPQRGAFVLVLHPTPNVISFSKDQKPLRMLRCGHFLLCLNDLQQTTCINRNVCFSSFSMFALRCLVFLSATFLWRTPGFHHKPVHQPRGVEADPGAKWVKCTRLGWRLSIGCEWFKPWGFFFCFITTFYCFICYTKCLSLCILSILCWFPEEPLHLDGWIHVELRWLAGWGAQQHFRGGGLLGSAGILWIW